MEERNHGTPDETIEKQGEEADLGEAAGGKAAERAAATRPEAEAAIPAAASAEARTRGEDDAPAPL
jgi:hypothetical protein